METIISITNNNGFKWFTSENISAKGFFFDNDGNYYEKDSMLELIVNKNISSDDELKSFLHSLNGFFAMIIQKNGRIYCAVDRLRSIPLFYKQDKDRLIITDAIQIPNKVVSTDTPEYYEFMLTGVTVGDATLLPDYKQLLPCEIISFYDSNIESKFYFDHAKRNLLPPDYNTHYQDINRITDDFTKRLIQSVGNRSIIIPLSGGYDSRYILTALKRFSFNNVICYTYGSTDSFETDIANKVASQLGYTIHTIEYTEEKWDALLNNDKFLDYIRYSFNFASLPHIQDFIALEELQKNNLIPKDGVFVPGFCGDLLGGSKIPSEIKDGKYESEVKKQCSNFILKNNFKNVNLIMKSDIQKQILQKIEKAMDGTPLDADKFIAYYERFLIDNRLAKFTINALRPYEFFGYEWRMPLWDNELTEYWYSVPLHNRINSTLYNNFLFDNLFDKFSVSFKKSKPLSNRSAILNIRKIIARPLYVFLKKVYYLVIKAFLKDIKSYKGFSRSLNSELKSHHSVNNINGLFAYWLLFKLVKLDKE